MLVNLVRGQKCIHAQNRRQLSAATQSKENTKSTLYVWLMRKLICVNYMEKQSNESKPIKFKFANMKAKPRKLIIMDDNSRKTKHT